MDEVMPYDPNNSADQEPDGMPDKDEKPQSPYSPNDPPPPPPAPTMPKTMEALNLLGAGTPYVNRNQ